MKYKDNNGIEVIEFGSGDTGIGVLGDLETSDFFGVNFFPIPPVNVGDDLPEYDNKLDYEVDTFIKLCFTKSSSVQVLIEQLQRVKDSLSKKEHNAIEDAIPESEKFDCPRMPFSHSFGKAHWLESGDWRVCSHCGSMHPEDVIKAVEDGIATIDVSDKGYKRYINLPGVKNAGDGPVKFYVPHFTEDQIKRFNVAVRGF